MSKCGVCGEVVEPEARAYSFRAEKRQRRSLQYHQTCTDDIQRRWEEGESYSYIALELDLTRGSVGGIIFRYIPPDAIRGPTTKTIRKQWAPKSIPHKVKRAQPMFIVKPGPEIAVTFAKLEKKHCRWPVEGWGKSIKFCGADRRDHPQPIKTSSPYCGFHHQQAHYEPAGKKPRAYIYPNQKGRAV